MRNPTSTVSSAAAESPPTIFPCPLIALRNAFTMERRFLLLPSPIFRPAHFHHLDSHHLQRGHVRAVAHHPPHRVAGVVDHHRVPRRWAHAKQPARGGWRRRVHW